MSHKGSDRLLAQVGFPEEPESWKETLESRPLKIKAPLKFLRWGWQQGKWLCASQGHRFICLLS